MRPAARNSYQRAAHRAGEARVSREQVDELLALATSDSAEDRLVAAKFLCPCHVRGRTDEIWNAIVALMADEDARIRFSAWHTLEDGGVPSEEGVLAQLEGLMAQERDAGVRRMAKETIGPLLAERNRQEMGRMRRPEAAMRGKCDFCAERDVVVRTDLETRIPTGGFSRPALICRRCDAPAEAKGGFARRA